MKKYLYTSIFSTEYLTFEDFCKIEEIKRCYVMKFSLLKENRLRSYHVIHNVEAESSVTLNLLVARTFLYFLFFNFPGGGASHSISPTIC